MYEQVSSFIPEFLNSLYKQEAFNSTSLEEIRDAFRKKQIEGKSKLLEKVQKYCNKDSKILVIGSWIGFTSFCLFKLGYSHITEIDLESRLENLSIHANRFNKHFKHITGDVNELNTNIYDAIINTSCEHMLDNRWLDSSKEKTLLFLQSTDYPNFDHINTSSNLDEMIGKYPMSSVLETDVLDFIQYKRFTLIGLK